MATPKSHVISRRDISGMERIYAAHVKDNEPRLVKFVAGYLHYHTPEQIDEFLATVKATVEKNRAASASNRVAQAKWAGARGGMCSHAVTLSRDITIRFEPGIVRSLGWNLQSTRAGDRPSP